MNKVSIMVDPGHDRAKYNQSPVAPEYWEGAQMWKLSGFLRLALTAKGIKTGCTKDKCDQSVSVTQRGRMAKGYTSLISLHSNACGDKSVNRPVGIYFVDDDCGKIDGESKELAKRLSETVERVMGTQPAEQYSRKSGKDRDGDGAKNDDYYGVLYAAHQVGVPAIILECSFHTNREAAQWLMNDANLRKLAAALADDLADYYSVEAPKPITQKEAKTVDIELNVLKKGAKGAQVKTMQRLLIAEGYGMGKYGADGSFGSATDAALRKFQKDNGLAVDGSCGAKTWTKLLKG